MKLHPRLRRRPSPATVIASLALFVALGGPAEAARLINGARIKPNTITSKQVKNRSLATTDLSRTARASLTRTPAHSIGTAQLREGAVGAAQLQPGSVTAAAMTPNSVTGADIIDRQVGNADIADSAVTAGKIATSAVRKAELAGGAVGTSELGNGVISTEKLADGSVTGAKVADGSLAAADIADVSGTVSAGFGTLSQGSCSAQTVAAPNLATGESVADDALFVTPPSTWRSGWVVTAWPASDSTLTVQACNVDGASTALGTTTLRVLGIDG